MIPRTARQKEVAALSAALPPLTPRQEQWAIEHCFRKEAYLHKKQAWCLHCGSLFPLDVPPLAAAVGIERTECPVCGRRLKVVPSRKRKFEQKMYYTVITTRAGWQLCRHFIAEKQMRLGELPVHTVREVVQNWIAPDGHEEIVARPTLFSPAGCYDLWRFSKPMELRSGKGLAKYSVGATWTYPERRLLPLVRRNGFSGRCTTLPPNAYIKMLLTDHDAETLSKSGQYALLDYKWHRGISQWREPRAHAIRIATRHGYIVRDANMWIDYIEMLHAAGFDTHNPLYICPRDLKTAHDPLLKARRRREAAEAARRRAEETRRWEQRYRERMGKYFNLAFAAEGIHISVINSVAEMQEEGTAMHHCVFAAGYYKKPDSLILSARDANGQRLETVEVSLKTYQVVQSRARFNRTTPQHDRIVRLVEQNMGKIKETV